MQQLSESELEISAGWNWLEVLGGTALMLTAAAATVMLPVDAPVTAGIFDFGATLAGAGAALYGSTH